MKKAAEHVEYALRVLFFAAAPFGVVLLALLVPMTAALVNMAGALIAFFSAESLLGAAEKRPWLRRVLRRQFAFEAYYRERPPRPFVYYVFYPLLLPYVLWNREARREFWLFKGYTIVTGIVLSVVGVYRYFYVYQPEIGFKKFILVFAIGLVIESLAVVMLIMPITTSVVALHRQKQPGRLLAMLAIALVSVTVALAIVARRHRTFPSLETRQRIVERNAANRNSSKAALKAALDEAWRTRRTAPKDRWDRETDGTVQGDPLDHARDTLEKFYRSDEAEAFELWTTSRRDKTPMMILFAEGRRKGNPVWLGMKNDGTLVDKVADAPQSARRVMRTAGDF